MLSTACACSFVLFCCVCVRVVILIQHLARWVCASIPRYHQLTTPQRPTNSQRYNSHHLTHTQASPSPRTAILHPPPALSASYLASTGALKSMLAATVNYGSPQGAPQEGTVVRRVNDLGLRFIHQFPGEPAAGAVWGRILRSRFLQDSRAPSAAPLRRKISMVRTLARCGRTVCCSLSFAGVCLGLALF